MIKKRKEKSNLRIRTTDDCKAETIINMSTVKDIRVMQKRRHEEWRENSSKEEIKEEKKELTGSEYMKRFQSDEKDVKCPSDSIKLLSTSLLSETTSKLAQVGPEPEAGLKEVAVKTHRSRSILSEKQKDILTPFTSSQEKSGGRSFYSMPPTKSKSTPTEGRVFSTANTYSSN